MHDADAAVLKSRERAGYRRQPSSPPPIPPPMRRNASGGSSPDGLPGDAAEVAAADAFLGRKSSLGSRQGKGDVATDALAVIREKASRGRVLVRQRSEHVDENDAFKSSSIAVDRALR